MPVIACRSVLTRRHYLDIRLNNFDYAGGDRVLLDRELRALSDPTRRQILRALRERDMAAGQIVALFPVTGASVSHHLSVLKDAGLVQSERDGRSIVYSLNTTVFQEVLEELMRFLDVGGDS